MDLIPSGKRLHNYGKSPVFMGKSAISMANIFKTPAKLPGQVIFNLPVSTQCATGRLRAAGRLWDP